MELLVGTSLLAAFIAGLAALFAPCCITVLLPSYFASVFKEKQKVYFMTFVFFLGVATVFLPLGLGAAWLGSLFSQNHNYIFGIGGAFLILLGVSQLSGKHFSLPFAVHPKLKDSSAPSVYALGIFSGIATTCCAPVLAGVLALAALPGSIFWGLMYTLSYVFGMVSPLFIIASFLDKIDINKKVMGFRKPLRYFLFKKEFQLTAADAISGTMFLTMGILILKLAYENKLFNHSGYQTDINIYLTYALNAINSAVGFIPQPVWAMIFTAFFILTIKKALRQLPFNINLDFMKSKSDAGVIMGIVGITSLIVSIFISFGNSQNQSATTPKVQTRGSGSMDSMADHHGASNQNRKLADLNALVGKPISPFSLTDKDGKIYSSEGLKGKNVVLFFNEGIMCYPACWNQIAFLSQDQRLNKDNVIAISIVVDPKQNWQKAINKMPALANSTVVFDTDTSVSKNLGMLNTASSMHFGSLPGHTYVVIDKEGIIRHVYDDPSMAIHNDQLVQEIGKLKS